MGMAYRDIMRAFAVLAVLLPACICSHAAEPVLSLERESICLADLSEDDAPAVRRVMMTNTGAFPVALTGVGTTCSCVRASVSRKFLAPGDTASVVITYNPKDQAGEIDRYVHVFIDGIDDTPAATVHLTGTVRPTSDPWDLFRVILGPGLRARRKSVAFSLSGTEREKYIAIVNTCGEDVTLAAGKDVPGLHLRTEPVVLAPGEEGKLIVTVDNPQDFPWRQMMLPLKSAPEDALSAGAAIKISIEE